MSVRVLDLGGFGRVISLVGGREWGVLVEHEKSLRDLVERLCGGENIGCFGGGVGEGVGCFKRREKVMWGWCSGSEVSGVGEVGSGWIFGCFPVEMIGGIGRIPGARREFVRAKVLNRRRGYRCRRHPGAWGLARPSSPVSGFAFDRIRRTTGGPVEGESDRPTTSHSPLAQSVLKQRSIKAGFRTWFLGVCGGEVHGR